MEKYKSPVLKLPIGDRDHILGNAGAKIILVEYGDFECNLCGRAYPVLKELLQNFEGKVRFAFRNFPLKTIHPNAYDAALAAEAAGIQGKFWEIHDYMYENQNDLEISKLLDNAVMLGLDKEKLKMDLDSPSVLAKVREDFRSGVMSGVNGTPTFFIDGVRYNGTFYLWDISRAIERVLSQQ